MILHLEPCQKISDCGNGYFCNFRFAPGNGTCESCKTYTSNSSCLEIGNPEGPKACIRSCLGTHIHEQPINSYIKIYIQHNHYHYINGCLNQLKGNRQPKIL